MPTPIPSYRQDKKNNKKKHYKRIVSFSKSAAENYRFAGKRPETKTAS